MGEAGTYAICDACLSADFEPMLESPPIGSNRRHAEYCLLLGPVCEVFGSRRALAMAWTSCSVEEWKGAMVALAHHENGDVNSSVVRYGRASVVFAVGGWILLFTTCNVQWLSTYLTGATSSFLIGQFILQIALPGLAAMATLAVVFGAWSLKYTGRAGAVTWHPLVGIAGGIGLVLLSLPVLLFGFPAFALVIDSIVR